MRLLCTILLISNLTVFSAPLPFPKPGFWGKSPVGEWVVYEGGRPHGVVVLRGDGTAKYSYCDDNGVPLPVLEPNLRWHRDGQVIKLTRPDARVYYRMIPPGPRDYHNYKRMR